MYINYPIHSDNNNNNKKVKIVYYKVLDIIIQII